MKAKLGSIIALTVLVAGGLFGYRVVQQKIKTAAGLKKVRESLRPSMDSKKFDSSTVPSDDYRYLLMLALSWDDEASVPEDELAASFVLDSIQTGRSIRSSHDYSTAVIGPVAVDASGVHVELREQETDYGVAARLQMLLADEWEEELPQNYLWLSGKYRDRFLQLLEKHGMAQHYASCIHSMSQKETDAHRKRRLRELYEKAEAGKDDEATSESGGSSEGKPKSDGASLRTWTDRKGRTFKGRLLSQDAAEGTVSIESDSGKVYNSPISIFSDEDQKYLNDRL